LSEQLYPFESNYADLNGVSLHYLDEGAGQPLLLLHGNPTWSFVYRDVIRGLRDQFRCIALDLPGFGLSSAPATYRFTPTEHADVVTDFLNYLGLTNLTMMVQDWGGPIGFTVAINQPDRFDRFVIGNTWAWEKTDARTRLFSTLMGGPIGRSLIMNRNIFVERVLPSGVKSRSLPDEVMQGYRGPFLERSARRATHVLPREIIHSKTLLKEVEAGISKLSDRPALILWPTQDFAFNNADLRRWEAIFPNHRTVLLEGAGHYIQEDAADKIVQAIRDWMPPRAADD
jgi:haloalkane dehalogenase